MNRRLHQVKNFKVPGANHVHPSFTWPARALAKAQPFNHRPPHAAAELKVPPSPKPLQPFQVVEMLCWMLMHADAASVAEVKVSTFELGFLKSPRASGSVQVLPQSLE